MNGSILEIVQDRLMDKIAHYHCANGCGGSLEQLDNCQLEAWLIKWWWSVPSVRKVAGSTPPLAVTQGSGASPSFVIACM